MVVEVVAFMQLFCHDDALQHGIDFRHSVLLNSRTKLRTDKETERQTDRAVMQVLLEFLMLT